MKKALIAFIACAVVGFAFAADTIITGYPTTSGIGQFNVTSDGTSSTLTVDKLVVSTSATGPFGTNVNAVSGSSSVLTNVSLGTVVLTNVFGGDTNVYTVVTGVTAQASSIKFASGICTNKP